MLLITWSAKAEKWDDDITANKSKKCDVIYLKGKTYVGNNGTQNYLIFQPLINTLSLHSPNFVKITAWKSTSLFKKEIRLTGITLTPNLLHFEESGLNFDRSVWNKENLLSHIKKYIYV